MKLATTTDDFCQYVKDPRNISYSLEYFMETPFRHLDLSFIKVCYPGSLWDVPGDGWKRERRIV